MAHLKDNTPQLEKGHTRIANELLIKLALATKSSGQQAAIMMLVMRFSYGFQRKQALFTVTELATFLDTDRKAIRRNLKALVDRKILVIKDRPGHHRKSYSVQKDWRLWGGVKKPHGAKLPQGGQKAPPSGVKKPHLAGVKKPHIKESQRKLTKKGGIWVLND